MKMIKISGSASGEDLGGPRGRGWDRPRPGKASLDARAGPGGPALTAPRRPTPPAEERSYLLFVGAALALTLGAGLVLALFIPLAPDLGWDLDETALIQSHGWVQLQGWLGLMVAGMALRLVPRLAHRPPLPAALTLPPLGLMVSGTVLRLLTGMGLRVPFLLLSAAGFEAAGLGMVAAVLAWTLARSRGQRESWRGAAWAATGWWAMWAALTALAGARAALGGGLVPPALDQASIWAVLLGANGNVIWAIQSRSVPVFYGRQPPERLAPALGLYNLGTTLVLVSATPPGIALHQPGLGLAGAGVLWLAPLTGAIRGRPYRLRPPSRPAARFVITANRWALLAGGCLIAGALSSAWSSGVAARLDDAALHGLGLGLATTLIVGMARLLAPVFAVARAIPGGRSRSLGLIWLTLLAGTGSRLAAAPLEGTAPSWYQGLLGLADLLTWLGLAAFALGFARAWLRQASRREALARSARSGSRATRDHYHGFHDYER